jgi:hypothetical protein
MNSLNGKRTVFNSVKRYSWYEKKPFNFSKCYCLSRGEKTECFSFFKNTFSITSSMASLRGAPPCGQKNPENIKDELNTRTLHK